jgi:hypothetical protein
VTAARDGVVLTADLVRSSRQLFQAIASLTPGADYDGWEASISPPNIRHQTPDNKAAGRQYRPV